LGKRVSKAARDVSQNSRTLRTFKEISEQEYFAFIEGLKSGTPVFGSKGWLKADHSAILKFYGVFQGQELNSVFCFEEFKKASFTILVNPWFSPHCGPWTDVKDVKDELFTALDFLKDRNHDLQFRPDIPFDEEFKKDNNQIRAKRTFELDLSNSKESLISRMSANRKRVLKKFDPGRLSIRDITTEDLLPFFKNTSSQKNFKLDLSRLGYKLDAPISSYKVGLFKEGKLSGGIYLIADGNSAYYLGGGFERKDKESSMFMTWLLWEGIMRAKDSNLQRFDFEGSEIDGIADFYQRFGASERNYISSSKVPSIFRKLQKLKSNLLG